jgi:hypothetical protein
MERNVNVGESKSHVISKIRRISTDMDKGEFWTMITLAALFGVLVSGTAYYFFI